VRLGEVRLGEVRLGEVRLGEVKQNGRKCEWVQLNETVVKCK